MSIQTSKLNLVKEILEIDSLDIIQKVADFVKKEKTDFWNELSTDQQNEIKEGIKQLDNGERITYSSFLKSIS
ncbi:hypothetical protein [Rasiella sp. SM2506]|uniref:hypothetical protein n=1 Tax=Rasiella sp. SM2506 TaxID=3423914 RepID=UPI003D7942A4